jgi:hypothetical protein
MKLNQVNILLADDDADDCIIFKQALNGFPILTNLATVDDGVKLIALVKMV